MEKSIKAGSQPSFMEEFITGTGRRAALTPEEVRSYSPLSFAYIGDAVYELVIRTAIVSRCNTKPDRYHHETIRYVNAAAQAELMKKITPLLTQAELVYYRRGLNARPATTAKNQSRRDYRYATALEVLTGYLYLTGQTERIITLISRGLESGRDI
ncbi:MAG: ribonuclease III [Eubacterium sp.]|nr:ribonuclease III [Eubacterium sp.]